MRIGIVCYPTFGGSGVMATELGKALSKKGHSIHFISYSQPVRLDMLNNDISFHEVILLKYPLFEYPPYESALVSKLVNVVKYEKLDILHVHYAIPHALAAVMARSILEREGIYIPVITTLHGTDITLVGKDESYQPTVCYSLDKSDAVTAVSEFLEKETVSLFNYPKKIHVIPNFVDFERFSKKAKDHFKIAIAPNNEKILVHTSNFRSVKRIEDVVEIFNIVQNEIPAKLLLVGDGPERIKIEYQVRDLNLMNSVRFLGKIDAVEEILSIADLFLLPSERESFGLSALEAMACQVPVISSDVEGIPEVNIHGKTGYLCAVGDVKSMASYAIQLLSNPDLHQEFKKNALARAHDFELETIMKQYEQLYETEIMRMKAK